MGYLYGDSSPFPLDDNFVETLRSLTDMCVGLLRIDERLDEAEAKAQEQKNAANKDQARLEALAATLVKALEPHVADGQSSEAASTAARIVQSVQSILEGAKSAVHSRREGTLRDTERNANELRHGVLQAMEKFFSHHEVPEMVWRLNWRGGIGDGPTNAQSVGVSPFGLEVAMEVDSSTSSVWRRSIRIDSLDKNVVLHLPAEGGWLRRGPRLKETNLDHHFITEVHIGPERDAFILRRSDRHSSPGLEIVVRADGQSLPQVRQLAEDGTGLEEVVQLDGVDVSIVERLWSKIEGTILELVPRRVRMVSAALEGQDVADMDRPARLAGRLIQSVSPIVVEMVKRSPSPAELVLKRDLGNGHRDEVYVAKKELVDKIKTLTLVRRGLFDAFQLGPSSGGDDVARTLDNIEHDDDATAVNKVPVAPSPPLTARRP